VLLPSRRLHLAALLALALASALGATAAWVHRPVDPDIVDVISEKALDEALRARPEIPLRGGTTSVVLWAACTLRQDRLEPYGHGEPTSPYLEALAQAGVTFEHNFAQAPWTRPSMGSIVTGRWPRALALDNPDLGGSFSGVLDDAHLTLAERLSEAGYATAGSVANPNLKALFGFRQGFDLYFEPTHRYRDKPHLAGAERIVDRALELVKSLPGDRPFFLFVNTIDTHKHRRYPRRYLSLFRGGRLEVTRYDAAVRHVDAQVARLHARLARRDPNVLMIVAADHGEGLRTPRHHGPEHGNHVYRSTVETPLIFFHPALPRARRVGGLSMNLDVVPTLLELLGLPARGPLDGASLAPAIRGETDTAPHPRVFSETFFRRAHKSTTLDAGHQLIRTHPEAHAELRPHREVLFAFDDPLALTPLVDLETEKGHIDALDAWEATMDGLTTVPHAAEVDAGTRAMLERLGYVED
jgi:arylsulfatase A-like enzyme